MVNLRLPASSANLGPGFDCLSAALSLYADISLEERDAGLTITGCPPGFENADNLIYQSYLEGAKLLGLKPMGLLIHVHSDIPLARGLGSSAVCVIAGLKGAAVLHGAKLPVEELLVFASAMEGHPDNAAACLYGGVRISVWEEKKVISKPITVHHSLKVLALIPDFSLSTQKARSVLNQMVPLKDAVFNLSRTALLIKALETGDADLLLFSCQDRLHQPFRYPLIQDSQMIAEKINSLGAACCISGAGPSLLCMYFDENLTQQVQSVCDQYPGWKTKALSIDMHGTKIMDSSLA